MDLNFKWEFKDYSLENGLRVFSTFACGGGSTMGYKLAGFDVIGANDIDHRMAKVYKKNHNPKYFYLMPIKNLLNVEFSKDFYDLDVLDGSPPCSTFSITGLREKAWGKKKRFKEGQSEQVLDDLFFDFIQLVEKLKPKVVLAENVKGMLQGKAKGYLILIKKRFEEIGYNVQLFLLNGAKMGLPQKRERVFFVCSRKDLNFPKLKLNFNEKPILYKEIREDLGNFPKLTNLYLEYWNNTTQGKSVGKFGTVKKMNNNDVAFTIVASNRHYDSIQPRQLSDREIKLISSFPLDYDNGDLDINYLCGMSVPPLMIAKIAEQIKLQFFDKVTEK